ncbi:MAG: bifunctional DNA-formamidopyrimidine glycosylase/DNA-(apurinic or apyrimidinic site) lyase [Patescibacteria group bacterium]
MPELPEVENLRIGLLKVIQNQKILKVLVHKPKLVSGNGTKRIVSNTKKLEFIKGLQGERFIDIERRAKNLIFRLTHEKILLVHLKMSGQFVYKAHTNSKIVSGGHPIELSEKELPNKHTHVIFELEKGNLYYNDTRMFGYLLYYKNSGSFQIKNHFGLLGLEPLSPSFTTKYFLEKLKEKKGKIKAVLMDQKIVTGLGNIYADESLFEAGIRPNRNSDSLQDAEVKKLHKAIIRILKKAVAVGGSSVATYRLLDNTRGNYAREHKVYGKSGKLCMKCNNLLKTIKIQTRTTVFCENCQK